MFNEVVAGVAGGAGLCLVGHPFATIKQQLQTGEFATTGAAVRYAASLGVRRGFYPGVESQLVLGSIFRPWLLVSFRYSRELLPNPFLAGAVTGICVTSVESPMLLLMNQAQARPGTSVWHHTRRIWRLRGVAGFAQGGFACALRNVPSNSLYLGTFDTMTRRYNWPSFAGGCAAGVAYCCVTYPLDSIRGCLQAQDPDPSRRRYRGWTHCLTTLMKEGGVRRLWRGYAPTLLRAAPANGTFFFVSDMVRRSLQQATAVVDLAAA